MRKQSSATTPGWIAVAPLRRLASWLVEMWRDSARAQELMLHRPWEDEGPLRWRRDYGGWHLIGRNPEVPPPPARATGPARDDDGAQITRRSG